MPPDTVVDIESLFQFKYCTIKSIRLFNKLKRTIKFQFKYCTIKRVQKKLLFAKLMYFNSSIVRLKVPHAFLLLLHFLNFNSSIVRLKAEYLNNKAKRETFQFKYCTIKSRKPKGANHERTISIQVLYD